jgi:hypothetical protein
MHLLEVAWVLIRQQPLRECRGRVSVMVSGGWSLPVCGVGAPCQFPFVM